MHDSSTLSRRPAFWRMLPLAGLLLVTLAACTKTPEPAAQVTSPAAAPPAATTTVGTQLDDSVITTTVKAALLSDPDIKSFDIQTETRKGEVQLSGFVDNDTQVERAIAVARAVDGVTSVSNKMSVKK